jgi:hypothetical protein
MESIAWEVFLWVAFANAPPSPREDLPSALIWSPEIREPKSTSFLDGGETYSHRTSLGQFRSLGPREIESLW